MAERVLPDITKHLMQMQGYIKQRLTDNMKSMRQEGLKNYTKKFVNAYMGKELLY